MDRRPKDLIPLNRKDAFTMNVINGELEDFFETGCEGLMWALHEHGKVGYDGLHVINAGDHLTVFDESDEILFEGLIDPDYEIGHKPYPQNQKYSQPSALGLWIHWTQHGWQPDDWARLFVRYKGEKRLTARLVKAGES